MDRVFLGGTCNGSTWRDELIPRLTIDFFNPVVEDWTPECQQIEIDEKQNKCNIHLYVITSAMIGVFSIAEAVESVHDKTKRTVFVVIREGFKPSMLRSLQATADMIERHGGIVCLCYGLIRVKNLINSLP